MSVHSIMDILDSNHAQELTKKSLAESARELFVQTVIAVECHDLELERVEFILNGLARASTIPHIVEGAECEALFQQSRIRGFQAVFPQCDEESAVENIGFPTIDWTGITAPPSWVERVGRVCGRQEALETKAMAAHFAAQDAKGS